MGNEVKVNRIFNEGINKINENADDEPIIVENDWFFKANLTVLSVFIVFIVICFISLILHPQEESYKEIARRSGFICVFGLAIIVVKDIFKLYRYLKKERLVARIYTDRVEYEFIKSHIGTEKEKLTHTIFLDKANITYAYIPLCGEFEDLSKNTQKKDAVEYLLTPIAYCCEIIMWLSYKIFNGFKRQKYIILEQDGFYIALKDSDQISNKFKPLEFNKKINKYVREQGFVSIHQDKEIDDGSRE